MSKYTSTKVQAIITAASAKAIARTHKSQKGTVTHLIFSTQLLAGAGLKAQDRVNVRKVKIAGPNGTQQLAIELEASPSGVVIASHGNSLLVQKTNLFAKKTPSMMMTVLEVENGRLLLSPMVPSNDNRLKEVVENCPEVSLNTTSLMPPEFLESLSIDPGWPARKKMLGTQTAVRTTTAGDQCYTARFIIDLVLRAADREEFDIDVCSMQPNGQYQEDIPKITKMSWGSVPEQFRAKEHVVRPVPANSYFTNDRPYGSLGRIWTGDLIWLNPPYSLRSWATFLECAHYQVDKGHAGIVTALVPCDNTGPHNRHMYSEHAYRIEITKQIPFFKKEKRNKKNKIVARNVIDIIKGNQFVVFGKGPKVKKFLRKFLRELCAIDYISEQHLVRYEELFGLREKRTATRSLRKAA